MPAVEWFNGLDKRGKGQTLAAFAVLESSLRSNRPLAGRAESVKTSKTGIWELRVTKKGGTAPHLRALFIRRGQTIWLAHGFTKQSNDLSPMDISAGERIAAEWSDREDST